MEQIKIIFELLAMINFNFWQLLIFVVIMLFRKQIMTILDRIVSIKGPIGEIGLVGEIGAAQGKLKVVEEIKNIENKISSLPDENKVKNEISEGLQSLNKELLIDALERIRAKTSYLWPTLETAYKKQKTTIKEAIRKKTFFIIKNDLELLKSSGYIKYDMMYTGEIQNDSTYLITVEADKKLFDLIKCVLKRNSFGDDDSFLNCA